MSGGSLLFDRDEPASADELAPLPGRLGYACERDTILRT